MKLIIDIPKITYEATKDLGRLAICNDNEIAQWIIKGLPIEQEPRKGHWIMTSDYFTGAYGDIDYVECSCCHYESLEEGNYCPNCGAEMSEVEE